MLYYTIFNKTCELIKIKMFWGLLLKANKKYTQTISKAIHLSQAALDINNSSDEPVRVVLTSEKHNYILCTLRKNKTEQIALDLNFAEGEEISFTSEGNGSVHLTGYLMPDQDDFLDQFGGEEESDEDEVEEPQTKKGNTGKQQPESKKRKIVEAEQDEDDDEDESDLGGSDEEDEEDDDDDDEEEEDDDEEESEEEVQQPKPKQMKLEKGKQNGLENGTAQGKEKSKKDKQSQDKPQKGGDKTLQGGVKIEEIKVGNGPEAKPGKKVQVYYEGRLKSNNKMFDSCKQGAGFKFGLGRGEVIRGWDIGVAGMKIGGKRRIICPPNMAYGAKGSPPVIPPNSTLVFEVELKAIH